MSPAVVDLVTDYLDWRQYGEFYGPDEVRQSFEVYGVRTTLERLCCWILLFPGSVDPEVAEASPGLYEALSLVSQAKGAH